MGSFLCRRRDEHRDNSEFVEDSEDNTISQTEFDKAIKVNGYPKPRKLVYDYFSKDTKDYSLEEAGIPYKQLIIKAMFLAQLIHESSGFQDREEKNVKPNAYVSDLDLPGRSYHGRGYIQLTWAANYLAASKDLGLDDELLHIPDKISNSTKLSMLVSDWYWKKRVRPVLKDSNKFGLTTKAINGLLECNGEYNERAARRYQIYRKVAKELDIKNIATEDGCYKLK